MGTRVVNGQRVTVPDAEMTAIQADWAVEDTAAITREREQMIVSPFQAKAALTAAGYMASVETIIAAADATTQLAWNEAIEFKRNSPTITTLGAALGLSETQIDDLFRAAAVIEA